MYCLLHIVTFHLVCRHIAELPINDTTATSLSYCGATTSFRKLGYAAKHNAVETKKSEVNQSQVKMSTMSDVSDTLNEINEMICGAIVELSNSPVEARSKLLPEVQRILSGMEFVVQIVASSSSSSSNEECSNTNVSLSWDDEGINERKCETITSPKPSHFLDDTSDNSLFSSSDNDVELVVDTGIVSMADVPSSEISCSSPTHKKITSTQTLKAPPNYKLPQRAFYETDSDENANERKHETRPQDPFVTKMSVHLARLAPSATYKPIRVEYTQVDFVQLNQRFIGNIPKPYLHPILGCSNDAKFYARVDHRPGIKTFTRSFPMVLNMATQQTWELWPCQTIQSMAISGVEERGWFMPVFHHLLYQISRSKEEEQEDEKKKKKRGDTTL